MPAAHDTLSVLIWLAVWRLPAIRTVIDPGQTLLACARGVAEATLADATATSDSKTSTSVTHASWRASRLPGCWRWSTPGIVAGFYSLRVELGPGRLALRSVPDRFADRQRFGLRFCLLMQEQQGLVRVPMGDAPPLLHPRPEAVVSSTRLTEGPSSHRGFEMSSMPGA